MVRYLLSAVLLAACNANSIPKLTAPGSSSSGGSSGGAAAGSTGSSGDTTPPTGAVTPASGASLPDQQIITLSFSESILRSSLVLGGDLGSTNPTVAWLTNRVTDDTATLTGTWPQGAGKTLTVDYKDLAGNAGSTISATYTVTDAPSVLSVTPATASVINASAHIVLVFSRAMDTTSAKLGGVLASAAAAGAWSTSKLANDTLTIAPASGWIDSGGVQRTLTVDATGANALAAPTEDLTYAIDTSTPSVSNAAPADNTTIGGGQTIIITFSEPVKLPATLTNSGTLGAIGTAVLSSGGTVLTITPATTWNGGATETLILPATITNVPGTPLVVTTLHYTVDVTAPTLTLVTPAANGAVIDWQQQIAIKISEPINMTANVITGTLLNGGAVNVSLNTLVTPNQLLISPQSDWAADSGETVNITVQDLVGNVSNTLVLTFDVLDNAVYVDQAASNAADTNSGTKSHPRLTIPGGIAQSQAIYPGGNTGVRVAIGTYTSATPFSVPIKTVLVGGWANAAGTWTGPSQSNATILNSTMPTPAVTVALHEGSGLQYFQVNSNASVANSDAIGVGVSGSVAGTPGIIIAFNTITADAATAAYGIDIQHGAVEVHHNTISAGGTATAPIGINATSGDAQNIHDNTSISAGDATHATSACAILAGLLQLTLTKNTLSAQSAGTTTVLNLQGSPSGAYTIAQNFINTGAGIDTLGILATSNGPFTISNNSIYGGSGTTSSTGLELASESSGSISLSDNAIIGGTSTTGANTGIRIHDLPGTVLVDNNLIEAGCGAAACTGNGILANGEADILNNTIHEGFGAQGSCVATPAYTNGSGPKIENNICFFAGNATSGTEYHVAFAEDSATSEPSTFVDNLIFDPASAGPTFAYQDYVGGGTGTCTAGSDFSCLPLPGAQGAIDTTGYTAGTASGNLYVDPVLEGGDANTISFAGDGSVIGDWLPTSTASPGPQASGADESAFFTTDYLGNSRTAGSWSIGAYQY